MKPPELSAWLSAYRQDLRQALETAARHGYRRGQANALATDLDAREFSSSARRHLIKYLSGLGLTLDGLALPFPGAGLADPNRASEHVERLRATLEFCRQLNVSRVPVNLSGFTDPRRSDLALELLHMTADLADRTGVVATINAADDAPEVVTDRVRAVGCPNVQLALDTAHSDEDSPTLSSRADLIDTVYLRDIRRHGRHVEEVPFGQGDVDFPQLLAQLAANEQDASLVIRYDGPGGVDALRQGREYMQSLIGRFGSR